MLFTQTPLHRKLRKHTPLRIRLAILVAASAVPFAGMTAGETQPYEKDFVITAYYSPLPDQCCYVMGGYTADRIMNGNGIAGADGTPVYPGMIAAPKNYAFGTVVNLPGIGTFTVHDRGGAITNLETGADRIDVWVGHGEEGLARALAFGVKRVRGTVYPPGTEQPGEHADFGILPSPVERLLPYLVEKDLLSISPQAGETNYSTRLLQESLKSLGYFSHGVTGLFGEVTQQSLSAFIRDFGLEETSSTLTQKTGAYLTAALRRMKAIQPLASFVDNGSSVATNQEAQRTLRFLGYYRGRTDGQYSDGLRTAIFNFQRDHGLVGTVADPGAGRIGPITRTTLRAVWNRKLVAVHAENLLAMERIEQLLAERGKNLDRFLSEGDNGTQVSLLQRLLADRGFFPHDKVNGNYGPLTKEAVLSYQIARGIVSSASEKGAGGVGPETLKSLTTEEQVKMYRLVRGEGWDVL